VAYWDLEMLNLNKSILVNLRLVNLNGIKNIGNKLINKS